MECKKRIRAIRARRWALAPVAYALWQNYLRYDPADPLWPNRDRFVLSSGHASMLLYSMLHLAGVKRADGDDKMTDEPAVSLEDIKQFRQLDSVTPGHPESHMTTGVETTTGPARARCGEQRRHGDRRASGWARITTGRASSFSISTCYALCSDGDMMEGVGNEAASLAGHLKLSNLCWIYDDNSITIEGPGEVVVRRRRR